ncbi:hypothetical protein F2Q69_00022391 [Brassica cretica]|uniref:Uncharacterized protein n=1 Tax=Brassica cretica TaxID=69181 RepID=A0A8S9QI16_BRACR|nr:hypothetical protein F2Q69_00022391 [Brassica cretica]
MVSQMKKRGMNTVRRPPMKSYRTDLGQRRIPNNKKTYRSWGTRQISVTVPGPKGEAVSRNGERDDAPRQHSFNPQQTSMKSTSQEESDKRVHRTQGTGPDHGVPPGTAAGKRNPPAGALLPTAKQSLWAT